MNTFKGHTDWITDLKICSKERKLLPSTRTGRPLVLLSASVDKTALLWDGMTGECIMLMVMVVVVVVLLLGGAGWWCCCWCC